MKKFLFAGAVGGVVVLVIIAMIAIMGSSTVTAEPTQLPALGTSANFNQSAPALPTEMPPTPQNNDAMVFQGNGIAANQMADATLTTEVGQNTANALVFAARNGNPAAIAEIQRIAKAVAERNRNTADVVTDLAPQVADNTVGRENHDATELTRDEKLNLAYRNAIMVAITANPKEALPVLQEANKAAKKATDARFIAIKNDTKKAMTAAQTAQKTARSRATTSSARSIAKQVVNDRFGTPLTGTGGLYRNSSTGTVEMDFKSIAGYNPDCTSGDPGNCTSGTRTIAAKPRQSSWAQPAPPAVSANRVAPNMNGVFVPATRGH